MALHLDHLFGNGNTKSPGCVPAAEIADFKELADECGLAFDAASLKSSQ